MQGVPFEPSDVLVVEDAPSGLKAGLAAGCKTLGVGTGQPLERFRTFDATVKALDLTRSVVWPVRPLTFPPVLPATDLWGPVRAVVYVTGSRSSGRVRMPSRSGSRRSRRKR